MIDAVSGEDSPSSVLTIELLGRPRWQTDALLGAALSAQDAALVALLAVLGASGRDVLAGQIWPEASQLQATNNLRKHVSRLRRDTGHALFATGATMSLLGDVAIDIADLRKLPAERLLDGEFLAGCDYADNDFLERWVDDRRVAMRLVRADALAGHAETLEKRSELAAAIRLAERIVDLAPQQEHAWRRLIRLHYLRADHTAAIAAFERFENILRDETGARPGPETLRLLATVERGAQARATPHKVVPVSLIRPPVRVGRESEWATMTAAWSEGRSFLLVGEAGIGKSRLLLDFVQATGAAVMERARAGDAQTPYEVLARLLRNVLKTPALTLSDFVRIELSRVLPELGPAAQIPGQEAHLRRAAEILLEEANGKGLSALLVDDLQFADVASLEALRWLGASPALVHLRFGFAVRALDDGPVGSLLQSWLCDSNRPERIALQPLDAAQIAALLSSLELPGFIAPDLAPRLHSHAGGHPLFTLETLREGWLHGRDFHIGALPKPQTVQVLLERRLRGLSSEAIDLMRIAAICGADLTPERAAALLDVTPLELADTWAVLEMANVLQGLGFSHDLMRESALGLVPQPLRRALHALVAEALGADGAVPPGRIADHWQAAERWHEAGVWWHRAGLAARLAGRLPEQQMLLERAAACHRHADDPIAEFESVRASFDSVLLRHGGSAVLAALARLQGLAANPVAQLQCLLIEAEALLDLERGAQALDVATSAVRLAADHPLLLGDALCLQGMALAQQARGDEAVAACRHAADAANAAAVAAQELRALRSLAYVLHKAGRIGEALPEQYRALRLAHALHDAAETAAAEVSAAALNALIGDVPATLEHARRAHRHYHDLGLAQNSTVGASNLVVLGRAAAAVGRFDEALEALRRARSMAGDEAQIAIHARSMVALATLQLTLGDSDGARTLLSRLPAGTPTGMRMQAALAMAQADQIDGADGTAHLQRLGRLQAEHPDLPIVMSAWIEWSYQGEASSVIEQLRRIRAHFEHAGRIGTARTLQLREIARMNDLEDEEISAAAARQAGEMLEHIGVGTCSATYPPEGWSVLAKAFERRGDRAAAAQCLQAARRWIETRALPHVPPEWQASFLQRNPVNCAVLSGAC